MKTIAVVVPTIRDECLQTFVTGWADLFDKHDVELIIVRDGEVPSILGRVYDLSEFNELIFNKNDGVRNMGFAYIAKYLPDITTIITLDDDTLPIGDPIQDHLDALNKRFPISWMSTASEYMRGVPYWIRDQSECVVSLGLWEGVKDWDGPTQLVLGNKNVTFYKGHIPKGVYFNLCGMNIAFKRKMLPYMYYAPMGYRVGMDRFGDIWLGIHLRRICDDNDWSIATGYSGVRHERASNVFKNIQKEALGLELNEHYFEGEEGHPYFKKYNECRKKWREYMEKLL